MLVTERSSAFTLTFETGQSYGKPVVNNDLSEEDVKKSMKLLFFLLYQLLMKLLQLLRKLLFKVRDNVLTVS